LRSLLSAGATPDDEYTLARSGLGMPLTPLTLGRPPWGPEAEVLFASPMLPLRTLSGRLSRLPPNTDDGARARTEASVSMERRRRRFDDEASVRIEASSERRLLAVAEL
jgi:hypothetical protein